MTLAKDVYLAHLAKKNGTPDDRSRTMSTREAALGKILAACPPGLALASPRASAACDALDRLVGAEAWGMNLGVEGADDPCEPLYFIAREEVYHVRIGEAVLALFGRTRAARRPSLGVRAGVRAMSTLPSFLGDVLVYLTERFGARAFAGVMEAVLADLPPLHRAYAEALFESLLRDEAEHAAWAHQRLGAVQRLLAGVLGPAFSWFAAREAFHEGVGSRMVPAFAEEQARVDVRADTNIGVAATERATERATTSSQAASEAESATSDGFPRLPTSAIRYTEKDIERNGEIRLDIPPTRPS